MPRDRADRLTWAAAALLVLTPGGPAGAQGTVAASFVGQGPAAIEKQGDTSGIAPMAGAVRAVVAHPTDPDVAWIGSVNGGIWKTTNATSASPTWAPLTDHLPSLSIGALELDPTFPSHEVLVAGLGRASAFSDPNNKKVSGKLAGILRSTDGGATWTPLGSAELAGQNLDAVSPRGNVIVVASKGGDSSDPGVFRSIDTGATFTRLSGSAASGLPAGKAYDLTGNRANPNRLYTAIGGAHGDIYVNHAAGGGTWTSLHLSDPALAANIATASNMKLAAGYNTSSGSSVLYAAIQDSTGLVVRLFKYDGAWTELDQPQSIECGQAAGLKRNPQIEDLSIAAHPLSTNLVFLGGDGQPTVPGPDGDCSTGDDPPSGRLFRCDSSKPAGSQCTPIIGEFTAHYTGPHPDSRDLEFDANRDLLNGDDGGVYRRTSPTASGGDWSSLNGHISITETHSCAHDHLAGVAFCGTQDNGTAQQRPGGATVWDNVGCCDGGRVSVAYDQPTANPPPTQSVRYRSSQNLGGFTRELCDDAGSCAASSPALTVSGSGGQSLGQVDPNLPFSTPLAANTVNWQRLVIASTAVYESTDQGATLDVVGASGFGTASGAIAYGGYSGDTPHANVLYVGSSNGLFMRRPSETALSQTAYSGQPVDVALDPSDWKSAWVAGASTVKHSANAGDTWEDVTGDLADAGAAGLRTIAFIPGATAPIIAVGAQDGVYVTNTAQLGHWSKLTGTLPNAVAYDLSYDSVDDVLLIATIGRGLWKLSHASNMDLPPVVDAGPPGTADEGSAFTSTGSFSDPDGGSSGETYSAAVDYGDGTGAHALAIGAGGSFALDHVYADNGTYTVTVTVSDSRGGSGSDTTTATVANVAPAVGAIAVAPNPAALGTAVTASAPFTDPGVLDTHTATIRWGDGTGATAATVSGSHTSGTASGSHVYAGPGVYTVTVTVTDKDGDSGSAVYQYAVVYDPDGGFLTGGGWIDSPPGAYPANPALTGQATFGFVSSYHRGQTTPDGNTQFQFHPAGFDFKATSYEWLVVSGSRALYQGSGTVGGAVGYGFLLTVSDGAGSGGGGTDRFRIKIWSRTTGEVVYDNQMGASDTAAPTTALGGGSIVIHP